MELMARPNGPQVGVPIKPGGDDAVVVVAEGEGQYGAARGRPHGTRWSLLHEKGRNSKLLLHTLQSGFKGGLGGHTLRSHACIRHSYHHWAPCAPMRTWVAPISTGHPALPCVHWLLLSQLGTLRSHAFLVTPLMLCLKGAFGSWGGSEGYTLRSHADIWHSYRHWAPYAPMVHHGRRYLNWAPCAPMRPDDSINALLKRGILILTGPRGTPCAPMRAFGNLISTERCPPLNMRRCVKQPPRLNRAHKQ